MVQYVVQRLLSYEMHSMNRFQILGQNVCIPQSVNSRKKGWKAVNLRFEIDLVLHPVFSGTVSQTPPHTSIYLSIYL